MIFVTVGTDGPFDRLVTTVDRWAGETGRADVVAQIGRSKLQPTFMRSHHFLDPRQFAEYFASADVIVAHAGMGTILSALRYQKPLLVMPRRATLGEQRNEHQLATARRLQEMGKVSVAFDEDELLRRLGRIHELHAKDSIAPYAEPRLIAAIRQFVHAPELGELVHDRRSADATVARGSHR
jgi:UDP-N-acetylglucosamine transferase subunit ALG13